MTPDQTWPGAIKIPNAGQEPGGYLTYILQNYDDLGDVVVFSQGRPHDHMDQNFSLFEVFIGAGLGPKKFTPVSLHGEESADDKMVPRVLDEVAHPRSKIITYKVHHLRDACEFLGLKCPDEMMVSNGAIFAVPKSLILQHPKEFYQRMAEWALHSPKTYEAAILERIWSVVFSEVKAA
jgi:hypothetical protein